VTTANTAHTLCACILQDGAQATADAIVAAGGQAVAVQADVSKAADAEKMVAAAQVGGVWRRRNLPVLLRQQVLRLGNESARRRLGTRSQTGAPICKRACPCVVSLVV
jgi:hypothetical protein